MAELKKKSKRLRKVRVGDELVSYKGENHTVVAVSTHLYTHKSLITTKFTDRKTGDVRFVTFPASVMNENKSYQGKTIKRFIRHT